MLARLVLALAVSGAVFVPLLELMAAEGNRRATRQRRIRSLLTKFTRKKLEIRGQLRDENMRPLIGVLVYVDISRCSLVLPLAAAAERDACDDERVVIPTDQQGRYRVKLRVSRRQKYLHVRFKVTKEGKRDAVISLASVDYMLGKLSAGSYYRLDRKPQLALLREPRDLIYVRRRVALHPSQLQAPWLQENRYLIARTLARTLREMLEGDRVDDEQEVIVVSSCGYSMLRRDELDIDEQPLRLVDFGFMLPAAGLAAENITEPDCDMHREPLSRIAL